MTVRFWLETRTTAPADIVFAVSLNVEAHTRSMRDSDERAVAGVTSGELGLGDEVTWRARHFGRRWEMTSRITELDRPRRFVDEQVRGPFARYRHEHRFEDAGDGGTVMHDEIRFDAPLWLLGDLTERAVLRRYVRRLIEARNSVIADEAAKPAGGDA